MLIITTGKEVHYFTLESMLNGKVRVLAREHLRVLVDNNVAFWNAFRAAWEESVPEMVYAPPRGLDNSEKMKYTD